MNVGKSVLAPALAGVLVAGLGAGAIVVAAATQTGTMQQMNGFRPYTAEAFSAAKADGKTTVLFFHAPWCPVCKAQEPKVTGHLNGDARNVIAFRVDYDSNVALRKELAVEKQSTLIMYQGRTEVARLSYKSDDASITEFFGHAAMGMSGSR